MDSNKLFSLLRTLPLAGLNPLVMIATGALLLVLLVYLLFAGGSGQNENEKVLVQAQKSLERVSVAVQDLRLVLRDQRVQELALQAASDPGKLPGLQQYVSDNVSQLIDLKLYGPELESLRGREMGPYGYSILDMLLTARRTGQGAARMHGSGADAYFAMVAGVGAVESPSAYLLVKLKPDFILNTFNASLPEPGVFALYQYNGRHPATVLRPLAELIESDERIARIQVPNTLLRIGVVQGMNTYQYGGVLHALVFIVALFLLVTGVMLKLRPLRVLEKLHEDPLQIGREPGQGAQPSDGPWQADHLHGGDTEGPAHEPDGFADDGIGRVDLPDLSFKLENQEVQVRKTATPLEMSPNIFRAYDIRGIVGKTLDAGIARQVGQAVGSIALEKDAGPVVVARDGRLSGAELAEGMIEGISSSGCDVIDIGAVPTGVLYFSAYELAPGSGVMVTGSHNPPDYNGFKLLIGGMTLAGEEITGVFERIRAGNLRVGKGAVSRESMIERYRSKISADIQLQKPLRIVADCGNGIGGVCAADVLRDVGATVIPLFDEVDGNFPNHHPDPSEPENMQDLIESVELMEADLGVAFDGDADRLGVVTPDGKIVYADRLMMLFAKDVLSRVPGSTIIYDVKCTGHLHEVIEAAGGNAMMYKTGHSLIKNKMKEVDAPFAGEMSGHFFFKERWYGFDCGIYAAARLLEILAADERSTLEVLNSLPDSVSTPELKVLMEEGENHAFVAEMQERAHFGDAKINTIDGVRADFADGWGLVRASNTTPVLVLRFDADSEAALQRIQGIFKQQMLAINDQLSLPF